MLDPTLPTTEDVHPHGDGWAKASTVQALELFSLADREAVVAVQGAREELAQAIDAIALRMQAGGRLFYVGAGTSGRLAALDAAECPPTFQSDPDQVQALLAGGSQAMRAAVEGAEDDEEAGVRTIETRKVRPEDCVLGISASGGAAFVHGALGAAQSLGAWTGILTCVAKPPRSADYDQQIRLLTGPELLSGSTRMKAGSATKMALSALSTLVMAKLGKVYGHRMVDVATHGNQKLWRRGVRLVAEIAQLSPERAEEYLKLANGSVKLATLMERGSLSLEKARGWLRKHEGHLDRALEALPQRASDK